MDAASSRPQLPAAITEGKIVAIARGMPTESILTAAGALAKAGVRALEITLNSEQAVEGIAALTERFDPDDLLIGAGTVMTVDEAAAAHDAGARFLVSPDTGEDRLSWAAEHGVPALPGTFTATEIVRAWRLGAAAVKLFPSGPVGADYLKAMRGPLADIPFIPTGGIDASNARAFLDAGAVAVGVGGWLFGDGDPATVTDRAQQLIGAIGD